MKQSDDIGVTLGRVRKWLLSGAALTIPLVITILVLGVVVNFLFNVVSPVVTLVEIIPGVTPVVEGFLIQLTSLLSLLGLVIAIGAVADLTEDNYAPTFHSAVEAVPVAGDVYRSFRRMSDVFVESDIETFRDVKLVEFPHEGAYSIAFVTADTPGKIQAAAGEIEMQTLFVPLAPNPVMGGFLVNFTAEQIHEVDLTVEEAVQSIVTSGVSVEVADRDRDRPMSMDELSDMTMDPINDAFDGDRATDEDREP
ncbi:DUF502 domain-containing protein [Halomicroarcula sp. GCM10025709]|uniref:DUF502 domain-containing protein n=1 Tax=Haloarcula TaxID=2237 RepID=UPI0024C33308|nr:DUF502 domain-containing protein [Halomicroarcula sp. YJ-61-S]